MARRSKSILNIINIHQNGSRLCWAASIKMVLDYLDIGNNITQGGLADNLNLVLNQNLRGGKVPLTQLEITECDSFTYVCNPSNFITSAANKNWNFDLPNVSRQLFDILFSKNGFYSVQDQEKLEWEWVVYQIKNCKRPFIIVIYQKGENGEIVGEITHAVVVRGIWTDQNGIKYLYVNDPLADNPCIGNSYSLHFDNLMSDTTGLSVSTFVVNIVNKDDKGLTFTNAANSYFDTNITYDDLGAIESELLVL
jgi:hypothetical protein